MDENKFRQLIEKYQDGTATPEEMKVVDAFFESYRKEGKEWPYEIMGSPEESENTILEQILEKHKSHETVIAHQLGGLAWVWKIAATLLIFFLVGYGTYIIKFQQRQPTMAAEVNDFTPGGDNAILKLADGTEIVLDSTGESLIPAQGTVNIVNKGGKISYQADRIPAEVHYNTIITPRGRQYQVRLADGSRVWLNAASSLRYPTAFSGSERVVELTGEAYFEIAENNASPFKVRMSSGAEVHVLGTHFNVMAYQEEGPMKTTLLEGSVRLTKGAVTGILEPGQQAQLSSEDTLVIIKDYDVEVAVAWKNGKFVFNDTELDEIMRQVSRWYDVDVAFEDDDLRALQFGGVVSRRENASAVLGLLELTGEVDFEIQGREIVVKSNEK